MFFDGFGYHGSSFEQTYRCYSASFIDKPQLESGDKIIMPLSALDRLASLHIDYPMLFELRNAATERVSHCGVLEFIAEEGMIYMPYWMMQNLLLQEGDTVRVKNAILPKGTYVKLQPDTKDFLDISNPEAILGTTLRNFSCLTTGDSIMVAYNNKKYYIDIVETKPSSAISIIETDCKVDFAPPLDYKEPERPQPSIPTSKASVPGLEDMPVTPPPTAQRTEGGQQHREDMITQQMMDGLAAILDGFTAILEIRRSRPAQTAAPPPAPDTSAGPLIAPDTTAPADRDDTGHADDDGNLEAEDVKP